MIKTDNLKEIYPDFIAYKELANQAFDLIRTSSIGFVNLPNN